MQANLHIIPGWRCRSFADAPSCGLRMGWDPPQSSRLLHVGDTFSKFCTATAGSSIVHFPFRKARRKLNKNEFRNVLFTFYSLCLLGASEFKKAPKQIENGWRVFVSVCENTGWICLLFPLSIQLVKAPKVRRIFEATLVFLLVCLLILSLFVKTLCEHRYSWENRPDFVHNHLFRFKSKEMWQHKRKKRDSGVVTKKLALLHLVTFFLDIVMLNKWQKLLRWMSSPTKKS